MGNLVTLGKMHTKLIDFWLESWCPAKTPTCMETYRLGLSNQGIDRGFMVATKLPLPARLASSYLQITQ